MNNHTGNPPPRLVPAGTAPSAASVEEILELSRAGRWGELETRARKVVAHHPGHLLGWIALGKALLQLGHWGEALEPLSRVRQLAPGDADAHNDLGYAHYQLGRVAEAEACYRQAIRCAPRFAQAYNNLGVLLTDQGRLAEASVHLRHSLKFNPAAADTHSNLGCVLRNLGRLIESESCYRHALTLDPGSDLAQHGLGILLGLFGSRDAEAISCLERSIALNPNAADPHITLGNLQMRTGQPERAAASYRRAQELRPLITRRAVKEQPDFSVLLLDAPGPGCTPISYLAGSAPYDCHYHCVIPDAPEDLDLLRSKADVVVNLIADADSGRDMLPVAHQLVERIGRPTVNHPGLIVHTDRETVARRLTGIPRCRAPRTARLAGTQLVQAARSACPDGFTLPLLVRLAGNHGGDDFERVTEMSALAKFVSRRPEADYYLIEYVDYRSADGFFRKYRFICIDGELFPYHLAIHEDWKVHHFRTDMANQRWMRQEEAAFLKDPQLVFDPQCQEALRAVVAATGLNYGGIDCALDPAGQVVVFETNATMLVHEEKDEMFTYKNPYVERIKIAFDAMLGRLAAGGRSVAPCQAGTIAPQPRSHQVGQGEAAEACHPSLGKFPGSRLGTSGARASG